MQGLAYNSCDKAEAFRDPDKQLKSPNKKNRSMLRTSPSFSIYNSVEDEEKIGEALERSVTNGERIDIDGVGSGEFSFGKTNIGLIEEEGEDDEEGGGLNGIQGLSIEEEEVEPPSPPIYLASGLDGGEVVDFTLANFDESGDVEEYYKRMVDEYPCHPLLLRNYAKFLQVR